MSIDLFYPAEWMSRTCVNHILGNPETATCAYIVFDGTINKLITVRYFTTRDEAVLFAGNEWSMGNRVEIYNGSKMFINEHSYFQIVDSVFYFFGEAVDAETYIRLFDRDSLDELRQPRLMQWFLTLKSDPLLIARMSMIEPVKLSLYRNVSALHTYSIKELQLSLNRMDTDCENVYVSQFLNLFKEYIDDYCLTEY